MTQKEFNKKRDAIAASDADIEIRTRAMQELEAKYFLKVDRAKEQIAESAPEVPVMESE